jgi:hypothetical protein
MGVVEGEEKDIMQVMLFALLKQERSGWPTGSGGWVACSERAELFTYPYLQFSICPWFPASGYLYLNIKKKLKLRGSSVFRGGKNNEWPRVEVVFGKGEKRFMASLIDFTKR